MFIVTPAGRDNNQANAITVDLFFCRKDHKFESMPLEAWWFNTRRKISLVLLATGKPTSTSDSCSTTQ
jgi:hypothetical protein